MTFMDYLHSAYSKAKISPNAVLLCSPTLTGYTKFGRNDLYDLTI